MLRTYCKSSAKMAEFLGAGKVKKVALVACMRKLMTILNVMMRTMTVWQPEIILKRVSVET